MSKLSRVSRCGPHGGAHTSSLRFLCCIAAARRWDSSACQSWSHISTNCLSMMVQMKFRTKDCSYAAHTFSHLAHGAWISWRGVSIYHDVSAGFQPNAPQQDYQLEWAQHALKIKRSQSLHSHDQSCQVDNGPLEVSNNLKGLRTCSTHIESSCSWH